MTFNKLYSSDNIELDKDIDLLKLNYKTKETSTCNVINYDKLQVFLLKCLSSLGHFIEMEGHKPTILYFIIGSLKLINKYDDSIKDSCLKLISNCSVVKDNRLIGFRGGDFTGFKSSESTNYINDIPHIASTYSIIAVLSMINIPLLSKEFSNYLSKELKISNLIISSDEIIGNIKYYQNESGCISCLYSNTNSEQDSRFIYCAYLIREFMILEQLSVDLNMQLDHSIIWSIIYQKKNTHTNSQLMIDKYLQLKTKYADFISIDKNIINYIESVYCYDGGFSIFPSGESNAGITFCSIATLLLGNLEISKFNMNKTISWLMNKYKSNGVNGRINKKPDTCYTFWVSGSLMNISLYSNIENLLDLIEKESCIDFIMKCKSINEGFCKHESKVSTPDILHTFYSLCTLSICSYDSISKINPLLVIPIN